MSKVTNSWNVFSKMENPGLVSSSSSLYGGWSEGPTSAYLSSTAMFSKVDIIKSVYSRIALDASTVEFRHLKLNQEGQQRPIDSELISRLTFDANIDQSGRMFIYDAVWSLLDEGSIALVPTHTKTNPMKSDSFDILSLRVGKIVQWYPKHVRVEVYNEDTGRVQQITCEKSKVAIVESPLQTVLSKQNKTLNLIEQKISLMSKQDQMFSGGKINGFIQVPYSTNSTRLADRAEKRRNQIESEMATNKYGLVMLDNQEKYVPAGGGINNNFMDDIAKLKQDYYDGIGITENIIKGTADTNQNNLYFHRVVEPCLHALTDAINRVFLTKTARTQGHVVRFFRDPFKLMPIESLSTAADLFSRNAIMYPNEVREIIGKPPHPDPLANKLFNRNIADQNQNGGIMTPGQEAPPGMVGPSGMPPMPPQEEQEEIVIYEDGEGGYVDAEGNPVDEQGNPIE